MTRVLAINGSYRDDGNTDKVVELIAEALQDKGAEVEIVLLRDYPIEFCLNCRECTQLPGTTPGECVHHDGMGLLVDKIEVSDAFIFASPTNFGSVTALFKRFMERLIVYAFWSWNMKYPRFRKDNSARKKAVLVTSSAAPGIMGRLFFSTLKQLKMTAKTVGADPVGTLFTGLVSEKQHHEISEHVQAKARALATKLI